MLVLINEFKIITKTMTKEWISHMQTGPFVAIDKEVNDVEEVQGSPGEEEEHADAHQNPEIWWIY